jgi:O-antigen/teichoic acid export membrane protein
VKLGWNLAAGFANSAWTAIIGLAAVPFYLHYLGIEAYGLIGFFTAMQALFGLLDMGLSPTINREVARNAGAKDRSEVRDLLHTLALVYWTIAGGIAIFVLAGAPFIADRWLSSAKLPPATISHAVMLMGLIVASRFPIGLYMGVLMGAQKMVLASAIEMMMATIANVGAVAVLAFVSPTIHAFFLWQAVAGFLTVIAVRTAAWRALRDAGQSQQPRFDAAALSRIWRFSAGMGMTALLGTVFMQSDKVVLSKIVTLGDLGRYTLAGLAARSLYLFMTPAFGAVYPRLTALHAVGDIGAMKALYKNGTRLLMAIVFPLAAFVGVFSTEIFTLWTRDAALASSVHVVVELLLLGTAFNAAMHFPYALQLAYGKSSLPLVINLILLTAFAPLLIVLAVRFGIAGAAAAWALLNMLYFFVGTWITHRILLRGEGLSWMVGDVGLPLVVAVAIAGAGGCLVRSMDMSVYGRLLLGGLLVGVTTIVVVAMSRDLAQGARRLQARAL